MSAAQLPVLCPNWEYQDVTGFDLLLRARTKSAMLRIRESTPSQLLDRIKNTRPVHGQYFRDLTPATTPYYAGNYRGQNELCLRGYEVHIPGDTRVGHHPSVVVPEMGSLALSIEDALRECDVLWIVPEAAISAAEKLAKIVSAAVAIFVYFFEIHPYANGNGHMARFLLVAILARHKVFLSRWQIHPRPQDPPYTDAIAQYRLGNRAYLERFVLNCI